MLAALRYSNPEAILPVSGVGYSDPEAILPVSGVGYSDPEAILPVFSHSARLTRAMGLGQLPEPRDDLRTKLLALGLPGVLLGAAAVTGFSALAFHVRDPAKPKWGPALILGGGSFAVGALALTLTATTLEPNIAAVTMGVALGK